MSADFLAINYDDQLPSESQIPFGQSGAGRLMMSRQDHEQFALDMHNFPACDYKREIKFMNYLKGFILRSRRQLIWMYVTLASKAEIEALKNQRTNKVQHLRHINQLLEEGWMAAKYGNELTSSHNSYHYLAAEAFRQSSSQSNTEWILLRDNW